MPLTQVSVQDLEELQEICVNVATDGRGNTDVGRYRDIRRAIIDSEALWPLAPDFLIECRALNQVRPAMQILSDQWQPRRTHIWTGLNPLFEELEAGGSPSDETIGEGLEQLSSPAVRSAWERALIRRYSDPAGAITSARTLLESVIKTILDDSGVEYGASDDLPRLNRRVSELLNLAPGQHGDESIRRILGGCTSIVEGLGAFRNRIGDSHGQGRDAVNPYARHATLTVNLAGAMALFLVQTWEGRQGAQDSN